MTWEEVCNDRSLRDLPYKIETNGRGQLIMSPAKSNHSEYQGAIIALLLRLMPHGRAFPECPIATTDGTKVPDVVWVSEHRRRSIRRMPSYETAPEICVEVFSPSNDTIEIVHKRELYFEAGAEEFWWCDENGLTHFHAASGEELKASKLCPGFPTYVEID